MQDLAGVSLLLGVRDNDLKGNDITSTIDLVQVHGDPANQQEHCLRAPDDDEPTGTVQALSSCRTFIHDTALAALDGLDATGLPDAGLVTPLEVWLAIRGRVDAPLPTFYVKAGQTMHALQDSFTHTFRTADGTEVTTVLNWVEFAEGDLVESRDGPAHISALDACDDLDAMRTLRLGLAQQASIDLLHALLDASQFPADKATAVDAVLDGALGYQSGCTFDNDWCNAPEQALANQGGCSCAVAGEAGAGLGGVALLLALGIAGVRRRRWPLVLVLLALPSARLLADEPGADDVPLTQAEMAALRDIKASGPRLGVAVAGGASLDRPAAAGSLAGRFRLSPRWLVGADVEWNPWIVTYPTGTRLGTFNAYGTLIRRYPMRFERVNLRTTLHAGTSVLLFNLYGAREGSIGPYFGIAPLGIDVHIRRGWKLVLDPLELEIPVPHVTGIPLYYEQFRLTIGVQYGA
jgi:MYXO-CTERM domain-containing protein